MYTSVLFQRPRFWNGCVTAGGGGGGTERAALSAAAGRGGGSGSGNVDGGKGGGGGTGSWPEATCAVSDGGIVTDDGEASMQGGKSSRIESAKHARGFDPTSSSSSP